MPNVGSRPRDDVMNADQAGYVARQVDDWELVNREAHHRMKNTLMLLAASVRRDFKRRKISEVSAAAGQLSAASLPLENFIIFCQAVRKSKRFLLRAFSSLSVKPCRKQF